jgi:excisionase family DNA binding protein
VEQQTLATFDFDSEVLNVEEARKFLHIGRQLMYRLIANNEIPHKKLGGRILLVRSQLAEWLLTQEGTNV